MSAVSPPAINFRVPDSLTELDQWVLWRFEGPNNSKVPYQPSGWRASSTDPATWTSFDTAVSKRKTSRYFHGIGYVFSRDDHIAGVDLDDCLDAKGIVKDWARGIVERFFDTYVEVSPSGSGLKIWARGALPGNLAGVKVGDGQIEMYDHARFFTVTGHAYRGAPLQVEDHSGDLLRLHERLSKQHKAWPLEPLSDGRIPHGRQHNTLVSIAGTLRARRVCDEAIEACLQAINRHQCEKPGPPENITRIVRSTRKWNQR